MNPQRRFLASTLQGALDADVLTFKDLYRHLNANVLAEHVSSEILWSCLAEGMEAAVFGAFEALPSAAGQKPAATPLKEKVAEEQVEASFAPAPPPLPTKSRSNDFPELLEDFDEEISADQVEESLDFDVTEGEVAELLEQATGDGEGITLDSSDVIEDLPPLPADEALIVEEVNWGDDKD